MLEASRIKQGRNTWNKGERRATLGMVKQCHFVLGWVAGKLGGIRALKINVSLKARSIDVLETQSWR